MLDLLIEGGLIIDGTGNPGYYGAVAVEGDRVYILRGDLSSVQTARRITATGRVVCPGFIDVHAHSGLMILVEPRHDPKVRQGVTTEVIGVDGNSYAPFRTHEEFLRFVQMNSGLDGNPSLPGRWSSTTEYLAMFDGRVAVNIAYMLGNSPLRIWAVGWQNRPANGPQLQDMKSVLREAMEDGAFGLSTGLDYPPGRYADTDELVELSREVARLGGIYHTHVRYWLGDQYLDPFKEAIEIGRRSGVPVHITHLAQLADRAGGARGLLELVEGARTEGLDLTFDTFPYAYGSSRLLVAFPQWLQEDGPENIKRLLSLPEARERLRREVRFRASSWHNVWLTYFKQPHNRQHEGRSIVEIANAMGNEPVDVMCDLLLDEDLQLCYVASSRHEETLPNFVSHPLCMVGSDAVLLGDYPPPMTYGTFPYILAQYVREEQWLSMPEAIRKMTSFPAQRLGLSDRGMLRDGMKADIVIFDPQTVGAPATRHQPKQFPTGIEHVIVNGKLVIEGGEHTGTLSGRALRSGHAA